MFNKIALYVTQQQIKGSCKEVQGILQTQINTLRREAQAFFRGVRQTKPYKYLEVQLDALLCTLHLKSIEQRVIQDGVDCDPKITRPSSKTSRNERIRKRQEEARQKSDARFRQWNRTYDKENPDGVIRYNSMKEFRAAAKTPTSLQEMENRLRQEKVFCNEGELLRDQKKALIRCLKIKQPFLEVKKGKVERLAKDIFESPSSAALAARLQEKNIPEGVKELLPSRMNDVTKLIADV